MSTKQKPPRKTTPVGEAKWAHVVTPKAPFEGKGEPKYQIDVVFTTQDPAWMKFGKELAERVKELKAKNTPLKRELDENDQETGRYYVTFKTGAKFKPPIFDAHGNKMEDILIGNGSKVRISYTENVYEGFGGGINLYLNAVQVVELVEYKSQDAAGYGFEVSDGGCEEDPFDKVPF